MTSNETFTPWPWFLKLSLVGLQIACSSTVGWDAAFAFQSDDPMFLASNTGPGGSAPGFSAESLTRLAPQSKTAQAWLAEEDSGADSVTTYSEGIEAYRKGQYKKAYKLFEQVVRQDSQCTDCTYYFAITAAQLGRYELARQAYERVMSMAPNTEAANLAQNGLSYLPKSNGLDGPPKIEGGLPQNQSTSTTTAANPASPFGSMDPETLQSFMLMSSMGSGGSNGGGFNPMMMTLMQQLTNQQGGQSKSGFKMDPGVMQTLMQQQMMGDFSSMFDNDNNK